MTYAIDHLGAVLVEEQEEDWTYRFCCEVDEATALEIDGFVDGWEWQKLWTIPHFVGLMKDRREHNCKGE